MMGRVRISMNKNNTKMMKWINTIWVTACAILFLLPLLWMLSSSIKTGSEVFASQFKWIPESIQWRNYVRVWIDKDVPYTLLYFNSLFVAVIGTAVQLLISSMAGYSFAKIKYKGKNLVFMAMLLAMMIPNQAMIIPRFILFESIGLYNTLWALIIPAFFNITSIFLLRQFFMNLPDQLMESAKIEGANHLQIWWRVMMPLTKPGMVTVVVLSFILSWNDYLNALIFLPTRNNFTVALGIQYWMHMTDEYHLMMAAAASAIVPIIVLFLFTQKYFIESIATTGVKG